MFQQGLHEPQGPDNADTYQSATLHIYRALLDTSVEVIQQGRVVKKYMEAGEVFISSQLPRQTHITPIIYWGTRDELKKVADITPLAPFKIHYLLDTLHINPL